MLTLFLLMTLSFAMSLMTLTRLTFQAFYKCRNDKNKANKRLIPDKSPNENEEDAIVYHELLEVETHFYKIKMHPISTLTWFKGDYNKAKSILHHRIKLVIEKNPWLQGRIILQRKGRIEKGYLCYHKHHPVNVENYLETVDPKTSPITRDTPVGKLDGELLHFMIENGPQEPLFRVCIIPCQKFPNKIFGLSFQMSHVIGDGVSYYQLLRMFCSIDEEHIIKLNPVRNMKLRKQQIEILGRKEEGMLTSKTSTLSFTIGFLWAKLMSTPTQHQFALVDTSKIEKAKIFAAREGRVDFVSTNDVITSWFFNQTSCKNARMAINWRNRLDGLNETDAGNYLNVIFYQQKDYASPALIRKSLSTFRRAVTKELPGFSSLFRQTAAITNWSSFSFPNEIEGCEEDLHLPIAPTKYIPANLIYLRIFRAGKGKLGLQCCQTSGINHLDFAHFLKDEQFN